MTVTSVADPVPVRRQVRNAARTRQRVLAAATREFTEHGLGGARIDRIAARARVNKQLIYYYFGGKTDLYVAVLEAAYAAMRSAEARLHLADLDPVEGITRLAQFTWRYHIDNPGLISLVRTENLHRAKYLKQSGLLGGITSPLVQAIGDLLRRGHQSGQFRRDADPIMVYLTIAALCVYYLGNHWTLETAFQRQLLSEPRLDEWGRHIVDVVLALLRAEPDAPPKKHHSPSGARKTEKKPA